MRGFEASDDLQNRIDRFGYRQRPMGFDPLVQGAAGDQFHGDHRRAFNLLGAIDVDAVGMIDRRREPPLAQKPFAGLGRLERVAEHPDLSILVLDVNMPRLNGLDMLDRLKENPKTASIPVLILTTEAQSSMVTRAKKSGAKAWLIKPVKMDMFVDVVRKLAN